MNFDFKNTFSEMLNAAEKSAKGEWKNTKEIINQFFEMNKRHLELIAGQFIKGDIDENKFKYRLNELKENIEMQSLALKEAAKIAAQNAVNAAFEVFEKAIKMAIL